jgi:hypothetical protein
MVKRYGIGLGAAACAAAVVCCQSIAGITDRELDPAWQAPAAGKYERRPPERLDGGVNPEGGVQRLFGARQVFLGTVDPGSRQPDPKAWRQLGYDIDGKCTTSVQSQSDSTGVCKRPAGSQSESLEDGDECRDNAGGRLLSQGTMVLSGDFELNLNKKLVLSQMPSMVLVLEDLSDAPDDPYVPGKMYVTVPTPQNPPLWGGQDDVVIDPTSVDDGDVNKPRYSFPTGYMRNHVWVSGDFGTTPGVAPLLVYDRLVESKPLMLSLSVTLNSTHDTAVKSVMSAVMDMQEVKRTFEPIFFDMTCDVLQSELIMYKFIGPNADLASGPFPFVNPDKTCDAMSWGFSIEWQMIRSVLVAAHPPVPQPKCVDAGPDGAPDAGQDAGLEAGELDAPPPAADGGADSGADGPG